MDRRLLIIILGVFAVWMLFIAASVYFDPANCDPAATWWPKRCSPEQLP